MPEINTLGDLGAALDAAAPGAAPAQDGAAAPAPSAPPIETLGDLSDALNSTKLPPEPFMQRAEDWGASFSPVARALLGISPGLPASGTSDMSGPAWNSQFRWGPLAKPLEAFGQGFAQNWGSMYGTVETSLEGTLKKAGIFNDYAKGQDSVVRTFNGAILRPALAAADAVLSLGAGLWGGGQAFIHQGVLSLGGSESLARDIAATPEAFMGLGGGEASPEGLAMVPQNLVTGAVTGAVGLGVRGVVGGLGALTDRATSLGLLGPQGDHDFGTGAPPVPELPPLDEAAIGNVHQAIADAAANKGAANDNAGVPFAEGPEPVAPPVPEEPRPLTPETAPNVDVAARLIDPDTFREYDALQVRIAALRQQVGSKVEELQRNALSQAPHQQEIADLQQRMEDTTPRLAKKYQTRLAQLLPARDAFLADDFTMSALTRDTPEISSLRQQIVEADSRMGHLGPDVTAAYQKASQFFPEEPSEDTAPESSESAHVPPAAEQPSAEPSASPSSAVPPAAESGVLAPSETPPATTIPEATASEVAAPVGIAEHVAARLRAAGRPEGEAADAGAIWEAYYRTRADRLGGTRGTAEEMYQRDAPDIIAAQTGGPRGTASGSFQPGTPGQRARIRLFGKADASTFFHESAHHFVRALFLDAGHADAPPEIAQDAAKIRGWLGAKEGEPLSRRQEERFARGFERYGLEGVAPSRALEGVFQRFRAWLSDVYRQLRQQPARVPPEISAVMDRMLAREPVERAAIAPEGPSFSGVEPRSPLMEPTGREPTRLLTFIRKSGGVRDPGGDITSLLGGEKQARGVVDNVKGVPLDDMALRAWEAGYFPDHGEERPSINDLKNAIEDDLKGTPRYSHYDQTEAENWAAAKGRNAEIDRLAHEHEIDTRGMSREQFYHAVAEKMSQRALEDAISNQDSGFVGEFQIASEGGEEHFSGALPAEYGEPRTLEDLENEHGQVPTALGVEQVPADGAGPAAPPGREGGSEAGGGPRGREPVSAGGAGPQDGAAEGGVSVAERPEQPAAGDASETRRRTSLPGVDLAGNIRLELLNIPESVRAVMRRIANEEGGFQDTRRGVQTDAQRLEMARLLNLRNADVSIAALRAMTLRDGFSISERLQAARLLLPQVAEMQRAAAERAAETGTPEDLLASLEARARTAEVAHTIAGATAEFGRMGRALQDVRRMIKEEGKGVAEAVRDATGLELWQIQNAARAEGKLSTTEQRVKFAKNSMKPDFWDHLVYYFVNSLLSNPVTHVTYAVANELTVLKRIGIDLPVSASVHSIQEILGHAPTPEERVQWGEIPAAWYGFIRGTKRGLIAARRAILEGHPIALPGEKVVEFAYPMAPTVPKESPQSEFDLAPEADESGETPEAPSLLDGFREGGRALGGKVYRAIGYPTRMVAAVHATARFQAFEINNAREAYRTAAAEGLTGDDFATRIADLEEHPSPETWKRSVDSANSATVLGRSGEFTQALTRLSNSRLIGTKIPKIIMPFVSVPANIIEQGALEMTPAGLLSPRIRSRLRGAEGSAMQADQIARSLVVGSSVAALVAYETLGGNITGSPAGTGKNLQASDHMAPPYSIKVGGIWYSYKSLGPIAKAVGLAADTTNIFDHAPTETAAQIASDAALSFVHLFLNQSAMSGVADLFEALHDPGRGASWVDRTAESFMPFSMGMGQAAREIDQYQRDARTLMTTIQAHVPFWSEELQPRVDAFGNDIVESPTLGGVSSVYEQPVEHDATMRYLWALQQRGQSVWPAVPERKVLGVELPPELYHEYAVSAGRLLKWQLDVLLRTPGFTALPMAAQSSAIRKTEAGARKYARSLLLVRHPEVLAKAARTREAMANVK